MKRVRLNVAEARIVDKKPNVLTIEIPSKCGDSLQTIQKLMLALKWCGDVGASRGVTVEEFGNSGKDLKLGFDGDGADRIQSIKLDGKEVKFKDFFTKDD